jgi:molybdopterin/thiamine biosynthesis adenylyltransferase
VGSHVAVRLAQSGVGGLVLVDPQTLKAPNAGRHALGMRSLDVNKAASLAQELGRRFPHMRAIEAFPRSWAALTDAEREKIAQSDLIVCAIGDWSAEGPINEWHQARGANPPIVYAWMEEQGAAGHALALLRPGGCLRCLLNADGSARDPETAWPQGSMLKAEPACGVMYQPFGPVELGYTEMLVANLCLDVLLGRVITNTRRICATSTSRPAELGGAWTASHAALRPAGADGHFTADRPFSAQAGCPVCSGE